MAEKKIVFKDKNLSFTGIFDMKGLFRTINKWFEDHSYDMFENKNYEDVYEQDKKIIFELIPYKKITDYHKFEIRVFAVCESLKEADVELKGVKHKLIKGDIFFTFDATLITDYEGRWESRAQYFFFRTLIDKFIYKSHTKEYEQDLIKEVNALEEEVKSYLNMFRYTA
jgi:hypothetical protein